MSPAITVRPAMESDRQTLCDFNLAMARETENRQLPPETVLLGVDGLLQRPQAGFYVVAESEGELVGSLLVTFEWSDWRNGFFWWIQSVYVRPDKRRNGVFRQLYQHIHSAACKRDDVCGLRLYVEQSNAAAQRTYASLGMHSTDYHVFECELRKHA